MPSRVGIYKSGAAGYSTDWLDGRDYREKNLLRELSSVLGAADGNLLSGVVRAGDRVVIKPNWVLDKHPSGLDIFSVITHSAVVRAVTDLVYEAMAGEGEIVIADAPQWDCDFENLLRITRAQAISEYYWKEYRFDIAVRDLRELCCVPRDGYVRTVDRVRLPGDPKGYAAVDLGALSAFAGFPHPERIYGADYDRCETIQHHNAERHEYRIARTILDADVVVHVPKLKVHKKVGVTLNAKGMVGINGNKNWVAHYRIGSPSQGGDEFPDAENGIAKARARVVRWLMDHWLASGSRFRETAFHAVYSTYRAFKPALGSLAETRISVDGGNWYGNDTAWRMTADLARIVIFAARDGRIRDAPQRRFFSVVDGIVGGEREGPLAPEPKPCGVLLAGYNLVAVDLVGTRLMGFDWRKVRYLTWLLRESPQFMGINNPQEDIVIHSNIAEWVNLLKDPTVWDLGFEPHPGWKGHIELASGALSETLP